MKGRLVLLTTVLIQISLAVGRRTFEETEDNANNTMIYDGNCLGCITRGNRFCDDFNTCINVNSTCPKGLTYSNLTGCPMAGECDFGFHGIGYMGEDDTMPFGGYPIEGAWNLTAPINRPCFISLVNNRQ
jgi:hypothetical protein